MAAAMASRDKETLGDWLDGLLRARRLEAEIARRAAKHEKQLLDDAERLREAMGREADEFRQRRLEAAYLYAVQRIGTMRRVQVLARKTVGDLDTIIPRRLQKWQRRSR